MNGPQHYYAAERLVEQAHKIYPNATSRALFLVTIAQVHATLADAAATAAPVLRYEDHVEHDRAWLEVAES